jgi:protein-L-isoaspartate(D-aspartate) O-methyltransferase
MSGGFDTRVIELVMALRNAGIRDKSVLAAIERTPRDLFVPQSISQPLIVALMTQALEVTDRCKVLEIGTGSGYQAAVLARLCRRVYTIERYRTLSLEAVKRFEALRLTNIVTRIGDGTKGWPEQAPFDRIIITAAAPSRPDTILAQLREGGICVAPVENGPVQTLYRYRMEDGEISEESLLDVRFVPLVEGVARSL